MGNVQAAIEAHAVSYRTRAGDITVRDVSLTVRQGELVAIIGSSGSGKATLLGAMSGLRAPTSGTVRHVEDDGRALGAGPSRPAGYVPAGDTLPAVLPLARALRYTAELRGVHRAEAAAGQVLGLTGLAPVAAVRVGRLNQGERKRAAVAAALLARPRQMFLDEPTAGLDPAQATEVLRLLRGLSSGGLTVLLTTSSPLDAARCDKVAVLAAGGHLAFFGTPAAARGYFGADSLEEIYERLAGLGDPAAAWSRRFFHFSRTRAGFAPVPTTPRAPGPAVLVPDAAGPHSAGRPGPAFPGGPPNADNSAADKSAAEEAGAEESAEADESPSGTAGLSLADGPALRPLRPAGQLPVLVRRNAEVVGRARRAQAVLAGLPVAIMLAFCLLLGAGALDGRAAVTLAWAVLGGLAAGLAYELPARGTEAAMLRGEASSGLSTAAFAAAKAAVLLPLLAVADVLILTVPAAAGRLPGGFGPAYLATALASALGLAAALAVVVVTARR